jgi:hypothetical protein
VLIEQIAREGLGPVCGALAGTVKDPALPPVDRCSAD